MSLLWHDTACLCFGLIMGGESSGSIPLITTDYDLVTTNRCGELAKSSYQILCGMHSFSETRVLLYLVIEKKKYTSKKVLVICLNRNGYKEDDSNFFASVFPKFQVAIFCCSCLELHVYIYLYVYVYICMSMCINISGVF